MNDQPCAPIWEALWHGTTQKKHGTVLAMDPDLTSLGTWLTGLLSRTYLLTKSRVEGTARMLETGLHHRNVPSFPFLRL